MLSGAVRLPHAQAWITHMVMTSCHTSVPPVYNRNLYRQTEQNRI